VALSVFVIGLVGCLGSNRPKTVPITGRVTINGQPPGEAGKLYFTPTQAAEGYNMRPANGAFDAEGVYRVMSWKVDDGLVPGHYTVSLVPYDPKTTKIPARYHQSGTTDLELDVPVDQDEIKYDIDVLTK
jgi:hypothetical protein